MDNDSGALILLIVLIVSAFLLFVIKLAQFVNRFNREKQRPARAAAFLRMWKKSRRVFLRPSGQGTAVTSHWAPRPGSPAAPRRC